MEINYKGFTYYFPKLHKHQTQEDIHDMAWYVLNRDPKTMKEFQTYIYEYQYGQYSSPKNNHSLK